MNLLKSLQGHSHIRWLKTTNISGTISVSIIRWVRWNQDSEMQNTVNALTQLSAQDGFMDFVATKASRHIISMEHSTLAIM
jgi:hypothetical protein